MLQMMPIEKVCQKRCKYVWKRRPTCLEPVYNMHEPLKIVKKQFKYVYNWIQVDYFILHSIVSMTQSMQITVVICVKLCETSIHATIISRTLNGFKMVGLFVSLPGVERPFYTGSMKNRTHNLSCLSCQSIMTSTSSWPKTGHTTCPVFQAKSWFIKNRTHNLSSFPCQSIMTSTSSCTKTGHTTCPVFQAKP